MPDLDWDDILLPEDQLGDIRGQVDLFASGRERFKALGLARRRGLLFTGPPGNGKTLLCSIVAATLKLPFYLVVPSRGKVEEILDMAFARAEEAAPCVLCFEELDVVLQEQRSTFLSQLDGVVKLEGMLILATTNHPEKLDPAILSRPSRFDRVYYIPAPSADLRRRYLAATLTLPLSGGGEGGGTSSETLDRLVALSSGFSFACLQEIRVTASLLALDRGLDRPEDEDFVRAAERVGGHVRGARRAFAPSQEPMGFAPAAV
jgi:SpoVK/Ycf46/Vps4 family AAA+-type ATPase